MVKISVGDRKILIHGEDNFLRFLDAEKRKSLINSEGFEVSTFHLLEDGEYTLGPPQVSDVAERTTKKQKIQPLETLTEFGSSLFYSLKETPRPEVYETDEIHPFLAADGWMEDAVATVLGQANLQETNNPRVGPVALVRCSRGGKTRSMIELVNAVHNKDASYGVVYITFNTDTPLLSSVEDPIGELCTRIAFAALKERKRPSDEKGFLEFSKNNRVGPEWVEDWLGDEKCILFVDELNLLQGHIGEAEASFLKQHFLLQSGRGLVFTSHVAYFGNDLTVYMSSNCDRPLVTIPLPIIPSLRAARRAFGTNDLSAQDALFLGLIPGLIVEWKMHRGPTERRIAAVSRFLGAVQSRQDICRLLSSLLTGVGVGKYVEELMTVDLDPAGRRVFRWIPFHMEYLIGRISQECLYVDPDMRHCLSAGIVDLFRQFVGAKWEAGDAWEALFLIVLIVRCLTGFFDEKVVPLGHKSAGSVKVVYNKPLIGNVDFFAEKDPVKFIEGIPISTWASPGTCALSVYYPGHARFEAYDVILSFWNACGERYLYGYQLKEGGKGM